MKAIVFLLGAILGWVAGYMFRGWRARAALRLERARRMQMARGPMRVDVEALAMPEVRRMHEIGAHAPRRAEP